MKNKKGLFLSALIVIFIIGVSIPLFMTNHKKVKADTITDLTNTTWVFNDSINFDWNIYGHFNINFTCNNVNYTQFYMTDADEHSIYYNNTNVYFWSWENSVYKTITITGGTHATNSNLIYLITSNATQQQPTPPGTQITHKYWASYLDIIMTNNEIIGDNDISYTVIYNSYTNDYDSSDAQSYTGLAFTGILENFNNHSYILSPTNEDIFYQGNTNTIDNPMLLEFTLGDYMNNDLYDLMDDRGVWFDNASVYLAGSNLGSNYGFNRGVAYGEASTTQYTSLVTNIFNGLGNILSIQVFPNITIGLLIGLPLLLGVFIIIIKILRG